jgi:rhodanese-related sulfurtransferase
MDIVSPHARQPRVPNARLGLLMTGLIVVALALLGMRSIDWFLLERSLRNRFPAVEWITTRELAVWLADKNRRPPVLVDVRTGEEWAVSHLAGARHVIPGSPAEAALPNVPKDAPVVTYCAVGYRSAELATKLRSTGFTHVQNLEGSIFEWANEHRPLVRDDGALVSRVHPYSSFWGRLLKDEARAPLKK